MRITMHIHAIDTTGVQQASAQDRAEDEERRRDPAEARIKLRNCGRFLLALIGLYSVIALLYWCGLRGWL